jgi:hypothetical protein
VNTGLRLIPLEKKMIGAGLTPIVQLSPLTQRVRVRGYLLRSLLTIVQGAGATAIKGNALARMYAQIVMGKRIRATGRMLDVLAWSMRGADVNAPADVPAAAGTYKRMCEVLIPLADLDAFEPGDTAPHARMFGDESIELTFADFAALFGANTTITGTVKPLAIAEPTDGTVVASPTRLNYGDFVGGTVLLPRGVYSHAVIYKEDGTPLTTAEISSLTVSVDGEIVANRLGLDDLAALWNLTRAKGAAFQAESATAPVAGEQVNDAPGVAAAAPDTISVEFLPLIFPTSRYKLTKLLHAESQVQLDYEGSATGVRVAYRQIEEQNAEQVAKAAAKLGVPHLTGMRNKTLSKGAPGDDRHVRLLPKRLGSV